MIELITEMLPHQVAAYEKMKRIKIGALYMEQGTGKSRVVLELIKYRLETNKINRVLWLCPCSTKQNLRNEIIKHTGNDNKDIITICGIETLSSSIKTIEKIEEYVDNNNVFIVVDESLLVKNFFAKRTKRIIELSQKCEYRMILNGTPVSRSETDLFAQWYILDWRILGYKSYFSFAANHIELDKNNRFRRCLNIEYLTDKISPYTFQVEKKECVSLPKKVYSCYSYEMTEEQTAEYYDTYERFMGIITEFSTTTVYRFFSALQSVIAGMKVTEIDNHIVTTPMFDNPYDNPRIKLLLNVLYGYDEKIIIFCKYRFEIDNIVDVLNKEYGDGSAVRFDGSISLKERNNNISKFKSNDNTKFFVSNKNCAGYGLNLQFASKIIFYNNDFNLGTRIQAEDRVHRIGQNNTVEIIDLICNKSLDTQIHRCLDKKINLLYNIIQLVNSKNENELKDALANICEIEDK